MNAIAPPPSWHAGEVALQRRAGSAERLAHVGPRVLRDHMPDEHREFFAELPWLLVGHLDAHGQPWASVLAGPPGFVVSPHERTLRIAAAALPGDPLEAGLRPGAPVGLLGLQAHTRRRNRMNGQIVAADDHGWTVQVGQSFGNCPKYIHAREAWHAPGGAAAEVVDLSQLDEVARAIVARADTFFIATAHPEAGRSDAAPAGVDVSHRGGPAGFVRLRDDGTLVVPDYAGNAFFNTLGNLQLEPRCGLLFIDHGTGDRLYLAATASLQWDGPEVAAVAGAQRLLRLQVTRARRVTGGLPLRWR
jgi:predicted pyridoxine 5'-phosphate oxidase superfamily flavin-nucleotide-binding protein